MRKTILLFLFFACALSFGQTGGKTTYPVGTMLKESISVFDTANTMTGLKIPFKNNYQLIYRYRWISIGKGVDNADSIKLLEDKIAAAILGGMVGNLRVVCMSYDRTSDYEGWKQKIKKEKPFKKTNIYKVEYYNTNGLEESESKCRAIFSKLCLIGPDGKILGHYSSIAKFSWHINEEKISLKGKVVTDDSGTKVPLEEVLIHVEAGNKRDTLGKAVTDKYGDFEMKIPNNDTAYTIKASPKNKDVKNVLLLTQEGKEISYLRKTFKDFEYKLLKADLVELAEMTVNEDITLSFKKFEGSKNKELLLVEDIIYSLDQFNLDKQSEEILNKVVNIMQENSKISLEILSHTDAQGDDASNLTLSQKRANAVADYLISKGISKKRISATGKGETQVRNRCGNGVNCTDKEHGYNRRTEFKFNK